MTDRPIVAGKRVRACRFISLGVALAAGLVLTGWMLHAPTLLRVRSDLPAMNPITALCLLLGGLASARLATRESSALGRGLALAAAALAAMGLLAGFPAAGVIGDRLFAAWQARPEWRPMPQGTAAAMILIGLALALMDARALRTRTWSQVMVVMAMAPSLLTLGLLSFGAPLRSDLPLLQPMPIQTAVAIAALASAVLMIRPRGGVMEVVWGDTMGSATFRLMIPVVILVPVALGWLHLIGIGRFEELSQSAALVATLTTMMLVAGLWFVARGLSRAEAKRVEAERALVESQQRLEMVLHSVGVGVWDWNIEADTVTFDDIVKAQWHVEHDGPVRMQEVIAHIHPHDRRRAIGRVRRAVRVGHEYITSYRILHPDGAVRVLGARGYVTRDAQDRPVRLTGINWDMTLQHEAELARSHAQLQQLELKDQFISHVSHELRSPLTVVFSFLEILLDGLAGELNEQQREFLEISQRNAVQLRQMIDDLLDVTRAQTGKLAIHPRRMRVAGEIEATLEGLRPQALAKRLTLETALPEALPAALADPYRVRQVLTNLVDNAVKFTPEGGSIRVTVDEASEGLLLSVIDDGPGIPPAEREDIFRQLYQIDYGAPTARKGLGLGLYICRQLVTKMGGKIWVESAQGQGSRFCFTLPCYSPAAAIAPLLTPDNLARRAFHLLRITCQPSSARSWSDKDEAALIDVYEVVRSCTLPDRDMVLPRLGVEDDRESILVLACGDPAAVATLERRIQGQLSLSPALHSGRLAWIIHALALDPAIIPQQDPARWADALARNVETALDDAAAWRDAA